MAPRPSIPFLPFLYPLLWRSPRPARILSKSLGQGRHSHISPPRDEVLDVDPSLPRPNPHNPAVPTSHLNPLPDDYKITAFSDHCSLTVHAGHGGNGCISFVRDLHFNGQAHGPPNGGDGGHGGNVYIAAAYGETSLHKLGRRRVVRAGRGKSGQGSSKDGQRGDDVVINVPVGTVVREFYRSDPINEEKTQARERRKRRKEEIKERAKHEEARALEALKAGHMGDEAAEKAEEEAQKEKDWDEYEYPHRDKWVFYPGISSTERRGLRLPRLPKRERLFAQPPGPLELDLSRPTPRPILIATGGLGGLGNPHFAQQRTDRPLIATKGEPAVSLKLDLELKLLADVGFVGLPNAGKSTLLRALTNSRARIGNWAFTTLKPNIGTVVLDNYRGRVPVFPKPKPKPVPDDSWEIIDDSEVEPRTRFTIADIPGLIEGAHLDRGLGMEFLRHVERAGVLAFVIDLSAGPAVDALKSLWNEVGLYAQMREDEAYSRERERYVDWDFDAELSPRERNLLGGSTWKPGAETLSAYPLEDRLEDGASAGLHIASKPWFVIATKCDLPKTQKNYQELKAYLERVTEGEETHPSGVEYGWTEQCAAIPVSAINGHGTEAIVHWTVGLLDQ